MTKYSPLPKESFAAARWLGPDEELSGVPPRWRGFAADLPDLGLTKLYPLREDNYGTVPPHIHQERVLRQDRRYAGTLGPLSRLDLLVKTTNELNGSIDRDQATASLAELRREFTTSPYDEEPELSEGLEGLFALYRKVREKQRKKVAAGLTRTAMNGRLYIVAADIGDEQAPAGQTLYAASLSGVINDVQGDRMTYRLLLTGSDGEPGTLPPSFYVPAGVCVPAIASHSRLDASV